MQLFEKLIIRRGIWILYLEKKSTWNTNKKEKSTRHLYLNIICQTVYW